MSSYEQASGGHTINALHQVTTTHPHRGCQTRPAEAALVVGSELRSGYTRMSRLSKEVELSGIR